MVLRGENVYCAEVEAAIYEHPDIAEAAVFGVEDERLGEAVGVRPPPERHSIRPGSPPTWSRCWPSSRSRSMSGSWMNRYRTQRQVPEAPAARRPHGGLSESGGERSAHRRTTMAAAQAATTATELDLAVDEVLGPLGGRVSISAAWVTSMRPFSTAVSGRSSARATMASTTSALSMPCASASSAIDEPFRSASRISLPSRPRICVAAPRRPRWLRRSRNSPRSGRAFWRVSTTASPRWLGEGSVVDENLEGFADSFAARERPARPRRRRPERRHHRGEEGGAGGDTAECGGCDGGDGDGALDRGGGHDGCYFLEGMECERCLRMPTLGLPGKTIVSPPGSGDEEV